LRITTMTNIRKSRDQFGGVTMILGV